MKRPIRLICVVSCLILAGGALAATSRSTSHSVAVPRVTGARDVIDGYRRLHRAGLAMVIPKPFSLASLCLPSAQTQRPSAGARVAPGATVTVRRLTCAVASPAGGYRQAVLPNFTGRTARAAVAWIDHAGLYWQLDRLPALYHPRRAELLDNYVISKQSPAAGSLLGRGADCSTPTTRCFRVTPLRLYTRLARG